jgi:CHC2 zinc finger
MKGDVMDKTDSARDKRADWVDLDRVKTEVAWADVLEALGLLERLERSGDELRGKCMFCGKGKDTSFSANVVKRNWQTFCCKRKGNLLGFVMQYQQLGVKEAGKWLEQFLPSDRAEPVVYPQTVYTDLNHLRLLAEWH